MTEHLWVDAVRVSFLDEIKAKSLLFVHSGAMFGDLFERISKPIGSLEIIDAESLLQAHNEDLDTSFTSAAIVAVTQAEALRPDIRSGSLANLRERVHELRRRDLKVCLVSTHSRRSYPDVSGSSLIKLDSASFNLPLIETGQSTPEDGSRIPAVKLGSTDGLQKLFATGLGELSTETLLDLDNLVSQLGIPFASVLETLSLESQSELRSAGFIFEDRVDGFLRFCAADRNSYFLPALGDAISAMTTCPKWTQQAFADLYRLERSLRAKVRELAIEKSPKKWRTSILGGNLSAQVSDRVSKSQNKPTTLQEVRDPLEWVTLSELVGVARSGPIGGLGLSVKEWDRFANEVIPIRNRLGHMRLVSMSEARDIRIWFYRISRQW